MKKNILITSVCVTALLGGFFFNSTEGLAEEENGTKASLETNASATFSKSKNTEILKPDENGGEPEVIKPDGKGPTTGDVSLTHVPNINFGTVELNPNQDMNYEALYETATKTSDTSVAPTVYELPHFVQVADNSGKIGTPWSVTVSQTSLFKTKTTSSTNHTLTNTRIRLTESSVTDSYRTSTAAADIVTGLVIPTSATFVGIPVSIGTDSFSITVLSSNVGKTPETSTNGAKNSVVFKNNYRVATDFKTLNTENPTTNSGVVLNVPYKDGAQAEDHEATFEWTLIYGV